MNPQPKWPRIRVAAIMVRDGKILVVRHEKDGDAYWLLPGGGVEYGESLAAALAREVREETGLEIEAGDVVLVNDSIAPGGERHVVNLYFTAQLMGGELRPGRDGRLRGAEFVPITELKDLDFRPDIRDALVRAIERESGQAPRYLGNVWRKA